MEIVLGIGDYAVSNQLEDTIKTFALGSCVAITLYSPRRKVLAMAHVALPDSELDPPKSKERPGHFADSAVRYLIDRLYNEYGCQKEELVIRLFGGSKAYWETNIFNIGERNVQAIVNELDKYRLNYSSADVGGLYGRTVELDVAEGMPKVFCYPLKSCRNI